MHGAKVGVFGKCCRPVSRRKEAKLLAVGQSMDCLMAGSAFRTHGGSPPSKLDFQRHFGQLLGLRCTETPLVMWSMQTALLWSSRCMQDREKPSKNGVQSQLSLRTEPRATQTCIGAAD
jgi:hypothetical protein